MRFPLLFLDSIMVAFKGLKWGKKVNSLMDLERERTKKKKKKEKHEG